MKKNSLFVLTVVFTIGILIFSCKKEYSNSIGRETIKLNEQAQQQVIGLVQQNLTDEYYLLTSINSTKDVSIYDSMSKDYLNESTARSDFNAIVSHRKSLEGDGLYYTAFTIKVDREKTLFELSDTMLFVKAAVIYKLPTSSVDSDTKEAIVSEGTDYYDYKFIKKNNQFFILEKKKVEDFSTDDVTNASQEISYDASSNRASVAPLPTYNYSPQSAVDYALTYYNIPNSSFYDYSSSGGDCTNFLSQCLKKGGWIQVNKWHWISNGMSCDDNMTTCKRSPSWSSAAKFYEYIANSGSSRVQSKFSNIQVYYWYSLPPIREAFKNATLVVNKGDIIQLATSTNATTVHHSTLVTSKDASAKQVFVTYRNATGYPVAKNKYIGDFQGGQYLHGFAVKAVFN